MKKKKFTEILTRKEFEDRIKGMVYGQAIGDALGAPCEFKSPESIKAEFGRVESFIGGGSFGWKPGEFTDDTDQMIILARCLGEMEFIEDINDVIFSFGMNLIAWSKVSKDVGNQTRRSITAMERGIHPALTGLISLQNDSQSNGSIMRTAPVVVADFVFSEFTNQLPAIFSMPTHAHPNCLAACLIMNGLLSDLIFEGFGMNRKMWVDSNYANEIGTAYSIGPKVREESKRSGGWVMMALAWAVWAREQEDFSAIFEPVNAGGDADTNAAVVGAILGARVGFKGLPVHLVDGLLKKEELDEAVEALIEVAS